LLQRLKLAAPALGILTALAVPAAAQASTKEVYMGPAPKAEKAFNKYGADVNDFFPHGITIHVGDSVAFLPVNFHTVDLPKKGARGPQSLIAPTGQQIAGASDAAGNPFWFNGQPQLTFNPRLFPPKFGQHATYNQTATVESGPPVVPKPKPFTVKFTKKGSFTYYCDVHPGMKGVVHVVSKRAKAPSAKSDERTIKNQVTRDLALAKKASRVTPPAGQVDVGYAAGRGVEFFGFIPGNLTVKAGTTLTFSMTAHSIELHTATFGPGDPEQDPTSYLGQIAASFQGPGPFDGRATYPSDPPGTTPASLSPSLHGNGFWSSGPLDNDAASPNPAKNVLRFDTPGTYNYYCMVHPFMHGVITVTS